MTCCTGAVTWAGWRNGQSGSGCAFRRPTRSRWPRAPEPYGDGYPVARGIEETVLHA